MKLLGAMALLVVCGINTLAQSSPATENSISKNSQSTNEPVAHVATEGKYGFIDKSGKYIIEPQFNLAGDFAEGLAAAEVGKKWGYIDTTGSFAIKPVYDEAGDFAEGLAAVKTGEYWNYINKSGKTVIETHFKDVWGFSDGLALFMAGDKRGYIDKTGKVVIAPHFDMAFPFVEGLAEIELLNKSSSARIVRAKIAIMLISHVRNNLIVDSSSLLPVPRARSCFMLKYRMSGEEGIHTTTSKWSGGRVYFFGSRMISRARRVPSTSRISDRSLYPCITFSSPPNIF